MFLSKKRIITIISITGLLFTILLLIQFIWIKKSIEVNKREFADKMVIVRDRIYKTLRTHYPLVQADVPSKLPMSLFKGEDEAKPYETAVLQMLDTILKSQDIYLPCRVSGRLGENCYIHNFSSYATLHNIDLDRSDYKFCLCRGNHQPMLDVGISFPDASKNIVENTAWLIIPSFILIALLIGLFIFIITIMYRQKSLGELKNDFINNLTHEFNTPLFSIGLTSKLLLRANEINTSPKLKKYIELITTEKSRLQAQVDKMLQLTAIESGSLLMESQPVDMHKLLEKNIEGFTAAVEEKQGRIIYEPGAKKNIVLGDEVHLFNTISSLLDNAYKYSDKQPVIKIATHNSGNNLVILVQDNGIGISDDALKMIFDKFYREKRGNLHDVKGFGLGLSYVKKIVEMHGGTIRVNSRKDTGTVFIINLPFGSN